MCTHTHANTLIHTCKHTHTHANTRMQTLPHSCVCSLAEVEGVHHAPPSEDPPSSAFGRGAAGKCWAITVGEGAAGWHF